MPAADDVNRFAAAALKLAEIPGANLVVKPTLKQLCQFNEASAAQFASNILVIISARENRHAGSIRQVRQGK
jgi:hypothetical protein